MPPGLLLSSFIVSAVISSGHFLLLFLLLIIGDLFFNSVLSDTPSAVLLNMLFPSMTASAILADISLMDLIASSLPGIT